MKYLSSGNLNLESRSYWYPDFPSFPIIDSILWMPDKKTVLYFQITVAKERKVDVSKLEPIHNAVKQSLARVTDIAGWVFKYVVIAPSLDMATALVLRNSNSEDICTDVQVCRGYVKYPKTPDAFGQPEIVDTL